MAESKMGAYACFIPLMKIRTGLIGVGTNRATRTGTGTIHNDEILPSTTAYDDSRSDERETQNVPYHMVA
eukprot:scaffold1803_cov92-Amphora_coffeaeformis.AAC.37